MTRSAARAALNEAAFRAANEQIERRRVELEVDEERTPYLCECDEPSCTDVLLLSAGEYGQARASGRSFVVRPGHVDEYDRIVLETPAFVIVEKAGEAGEVAEVAVP